MPIDQPTAETYAEVQHFYARQMQFMDERDFAAFAATFIPAGEFSHTPGQTAHGRAQIVDELQRFHRRFDDDPVIRRHWFDMIVLDELGRGELGARFYAYVVDTRPGATAPRLGPSCTVSDVLVRTDGGLLNKSRHVRQDRLRFE
ncbi:nuclear transport factor 2 family protein [Saccharopolyspora sp. NPDC047091]|uniref:nuclear transport factor 2 family protein n=1 Tax=Saccharopolyspora sp. NPDC047091 TaxID=3155924 RepID=UPI0033E11ADA